MMRKKKIRHKDKFKKHKSLPEPKKRESEPVKTLTGQPTPLQTDFESFRRRACATPILNGYEDFRMAEELRKLDPQRHTKVINFSSNYYLYVAIIAILKDQKFYWYVQAALVSRVNGSKIPIQLETQRTRDEIKLANGQALENAGLQDLAQFRQIQNTYTWTTPFAPGDYDLLFPAFRELCNEAFGQK